MPAIGELDQRVDLQTRSDTAAASGGTDELYTTVQTVWAKVASVSGTLYFGAQQVERTVTHAITVRGRGDWGSAGIQYIRWDGRQLRIERVRDLDAFPRFQEALCEEVKSGV